MDLLLSVYKLCSSFKIKIKTIEEIYRNTSKDKELIEIFYKWCNEVFSCEQGIEIEDISQLEGLFIKLFEKRKILKSEENVLNSKGEKSIVL